jgi:hypothetical protein
MTINAIMMKKIIIKEHCINHEKINQENLLLIILKIHCLKMPTFICYYL